VNAAYLVVDSTRLGYQRSRLRSSPVAVTVPWAIETGNLFPPTRTEQARVSPTKQLHTQAVQVPLRNLDQSLINFIQRPISTKYC